MRKDHHRANEPLALTLTATRNHPGRPMRLVTGLHCLPALFFFAMPATVPSQMFANLIQLITGRPPPPGEYDLAFIKEVSVRQKPRRNPHIERIILLGWTLIAGKCWLITWLIEKYQVPIDPLWIVAPTVAFALLCTAVYYLGRN